MRAISIAEALATGVGARLSGSLFGRARIVRTEGRGSGEWVPARESWHFSRQRPSVSANAGPIGVRSGVTGSGAMHAYVEQTHIAEPGTVAEFPAAGLTGADRMSESWHGPCVAPVESGSRGASPAGVSTRFTGII